ncbi:dihydrofolate reductase family protein [Gimesia algae]|uniref:Dihydrofolate reductase n=1 Tax=Gimesia algae TaxID=2527971 RepID=A0A517VJE5_9PLAN|nr:dihydrofolate reductase family protein [Gimesia algae]QDT93117.1 Dihydrofolate reductase [Gimesia algae]
MKVSVYIATSLDGFIARNNGALDWLPGIESADAPEGEDYGYHEFMDSIDILVMGRKTFETVLSFEGDWPYGDKRMIILSSQTVSIPSKVSDTVESSSCTPAELIEKLSEEGFQHVYVDGGKTIQGFLKAGLIDELIITRIPVLIGSGIPLFGEADTDIKLRHLQTHTFPNGLVQSRYQVI